VLVVQVEVVDAQPLQRRVAGLADVPGVTADAQPGALGIADDAELGRELHLLAAARDGPADQLLVVNGP
jgi:hypothetical protein